MDTLIDPPVSTLILPSDVAAATMLTSAYVMPAGTTPLIGQIPLAELDLVVDAERQELRPNPEHPDGPIIDALSAA